MGVPATTPPASRPGAGGPGRLKPLGSVVVVIGVVAVALAVAAYVMPKAAPGGGDPAAVAPAPAEIAPAEPAAVQDVTRTIVYSLFGAAGARNLTYVGADSGLEQQAEVTTPWSVTVTRTAPASEAEFASLAAQSAAAGALTCRITVDGSVVSEKSVAREGAQLSCTA
ncbi:MmpS family transport accessory protein [Amycolatopsis sp. NPDC051903]|uniref:MmpS family transport accessory protein n=1 Tax=Amycolatopsis sp. NPDC051903 TaxID=3363936 RepID=UPI00378D8174